MLIYHLLPILSWGILLAEGGDIVTLQRFWPDASADNAGFGG